MKSRREKLLTPLNAHFAVLGLLLIVTITLGVRLLLAWHTLYASGAQRLEQLQADHRTLELQMRPLDGLPQKVTLSQKQANEFYDKRLPDAYSIISGAIGDLAASTDVHLTRVAYVQDPGIPGVAEVRMDASLSGEYAPLMHFINGLERSKTFFLINGLTLTGQQGGLVNLRLRLTTYLHAADLDRMAPPASDQAESQQGEGQ
jgi:hypothetical protein